MRHITKKEMIYNVLEEEILSGILHSGEKLNISRLAKRFEVSEIPIREALSMLESRDLIEFKPHIGATVISLSIRDVQELFEIRIELEGLATRLAADEMSLEDIRELEELINLSAENNEEEHHHRFEEINYDFHMKIYEKCNNTRLFNMIKDLWMTTKRYHPKINHSIPHINDSIKEHTNIKEALERGDGVLAKKYMLQHKARILKEVIRITESKYYSSLGDAQKS